MKMIQNIQGLRGIAVLLVVFVHIGLIEKRYSLHPLLPDWTQFGMSGVDIFFVISGFIMMTISLTKKKDMENALKFIYSRIVRIYPNYWFYTVLILIVMTLHPEWVNSSSSAESDIVKSFLLIPQNANPLLQVGWTLIHEMYFYIGFFLLLLFVRSNRVILLSIVLWGITVIVMDLLFQFRDPVLKIVFHPLTLEFLGGVLIAYSLAKKTYDASVRFWKTVFVFSLVMLFVNYMVFYAMQSIDPYRWWRVWLFGLPAFFLLYASLMLEQKGELLPAWINRIGDRSYTIYLAHILVINAVGKVWQLFAFESVVMSMVFIVLLIASVLIYGKYAYEYIEVPMLKRLRQFRKKI